MTSNTNILGMWEWLTENLCCHRNPKIYFCRIFKKLLRPVPHPQATQNYNGCYGDLTNRKVDILKKSCVFLKGIYPVELCNQGGRGRRGEAATKQNGLMGE